jgi:DNA-directed RNA polymerase III subunit RPC1
MEKKTVATSLAPKKIAKVQFGTLLSHEIRKVAEIHATNSALLQQPQRTPAENGCLDPRLGVSQKRSICATCNNNLADCAGHFGYIHLELPVFHAGYIKHTLTILQCICKGCSRVLLSPEDRSYYLMKLRDGKNDALYRAGVFKKIVDACKRIHKCPRCEKPNGVVKKVSGGVFKIVHDISKLRNVPTFMGHFNSELDHALASNSELAAQSKQINNCELITPLKAYELLSGIIEEDMTLLWMSYNFGQPASLIVWTIPVPPVPIRPSVPVEIGGGGTTEDDLTIKLQEIIFVNDALRWAFLRGANMKLVAEDWELLQIQVAQFINGETPGIPRAMTGAKSIRGLCQRLKGKQGRFRGNLSGKRVDFSGRTVISPDPNLSVDQVGVPIQVAKTMTYPEKVNRYNMAKLKALIMNGPNRHPGANVIRQENGLAKVLKYGDPVKITQSLRIGDIVERHLMDGDIVLFNRQPSLHKMSIMAHRVKVMPWRTFRFNECACSPYNADFDGDEMNLHLPQTEEARTEAAELMCITKNLLTPRNGEPLVAATQDFLTCAFLLTKKNIFFDRADVARIVAYYSDALEHVTIPPPCILKPCRLWSGKQVMSMVVSNTADNRNAVNLETREKFFTPGTHCMCPNDGYVIFRKGQLLCGNLGKKTLGAESKQGLFYVLITNYGSELAAQCMGRLAKFSARFLGDRGFSIGVEDVTPSGSLPKIKSAILAEGTRDTDEEIALYKSGKIRLKPGCDALQSLESEINSILGKIRQKCGSEAMTALKDTNSPYTMARCGSKGSPLNISQMISCLGQQSVGGARIENGFVGRTLPHFPVGALYPSAKGFVSNSFYSGLTATEFFFHTMGGREGLVDTAVKTAETGYMARRLMKALEDLSMQYDSTVRNSEQTVVQFKYGDDSLNPQLMEGLGDSDDRPVDYYRLLMNQHCGKRSPLPEYLSSESIRRTVDERVDQADFQELLQTGGDEFLRETKEFFYQLADKLQRLEEIEGEEAKVKKLSGAKLKKYKHTHEIMRANVAGITDIHFNNVIESALKKYKRSIIEPGEAVGAIGAQSLSEPGTQMTLKTFHFAGVASMNVTLGVPRLKEIINASKLISTPIIEARLVQEASMTSARIVKAQIEKTALGEISEYIHEVHTKSSSYVEIKLAMQHIAGLHLNIDSLSVQKSILTHTGPPKSALLRQLKELNVDVVSGRNDMLRIYPPEPKSDAKIGVPNHKRNFFTVHTLRSCLSHVIVKGIPGISRAVINEERNAKGEKIYYLLLEGYGLGDVMGAAGVNGMRTFSNHFMEVQQVLGIEAARWMISSEVKYIMSQYGIKVNCRHLMLLSDVMSFKGEVLGITRFGVAKMRESVLMLASFEKTTDHLFDAAVHSRQDSIVGVSECIIMGVPIPLGTGLFKLLHKAKQSVSTCRRRPLDLCASE